MVISFSLKKSKISYFRNHPIDDLISHRRQGRDGIFCVVADFLMCHGSYNWIFPGEGGGDFLINTKLQLVVLMKAAAYPMLSLCELCLAHMWQLSQMTLFTLLYHNCCIITLFLGLWTNVYFSRWSTRDRQSPPACTPGPPWGAREIVGLSEHREGLGTYRAVAEVLGHLP